MPHTRILLRNKFLRNKDRPVFDSEIDNKIYYDEPLPISWPEKLFLAVVIAGSLAVWALALRWMGVL